MSLRKSGILILIAGLALIILGQLVGYIVLSLIPRFPGFPWDFIGWLVIPLGTGGVLLFLFGLFRAIAGPWLERKQPDDVGRSADR